MHSWFGVCRIQEVDPALSQRAESIGISAAVAIDSRQLMLVVAGTSVSVFCLSVTHVLVKSSVLGCHVQVTVWSTLSGRPVRLFRDIIKSDITCFCLHPLKRRFLLGTADGMVRVSARRTVVSVRSSALAHCAVWLDCRSSTVVTVHWCER